MKRFFTWFYYLSKRQLQNLFFLFILLIIPIIAVLLKCVSDSLEGSVSIGIVNSEDTELSKNFMESITQNSGIIKFIPYESTAVMSEDILKGKLQCGYEILEGFEDKITHSKSSNLLEVYTAPNNAIVLLSNELMFAKLFEELGCYTLFDDLENTSVFTNVSDEDYISLRISYENYLTNGKTFKFNYSSPDGIYISSGNIDVLSYIKTPVRGIVAVFVFIAGLAGGFTFLKDKKNKITQLMCIFDIAIPVLFSAISGVLAIHLAGINESILKEAIAMLCYSLLVIIFVLILTKLVSNNVVYCSTIPIFSLGSLVCCPIFVNLKTFIPAMKLIQFIFLPTYYFLIFNIL